MGSKHETIQFNKSIHHLSFWGLKVWRIIIPSTPRNQRTSWNNCRTWRPRSCAEACRRMFWSQDIITISAPSIHTSQHLYTTQIIGDAAQLLGRFMCLMHLNRAWCLADLPIVFGKRFDLLYIKTCTEKYQIPKSYAFCTQMLGIITMFWSQFLLTNQHAMARTWF